MRSFLSTLFALQAAAFPFVMDEALNRRQLPDVTAAQALSKARTNCGGGHVCVTFNEKEQRVSTTGDHAYKKPSSDQIRGPCPGLNAAANHGYLSRSGVTTIQETITGLGALFGMSPDLAAFLAAYAVLLDGDIITQQWSIGGPMPSNGLTDLLIGGGQGISYSHNNYEGDTSIARQDAYLNNGDAHSLDVNRFASAYASGLDNDRYTLDKFSRNFDEKVNESIATNPYYFAAPFSTTLVSPAAYNFVINFMSNHSAEQPAGWLDGAMFKTWFAVTGDYPNFKWIRGQERIPDNWYRRSLTQSYNAVDVFIDLAFEWAAYPGTFRLGGNTKGVNSYSGVSLTDFTGGAYNLTNLMDPKSSAGACFFAQLAQAVIPDAASIPLQLLSPITNIVNNFLKPITGGLDCPIVSKFDQTLFNKFPGYKYSPTGPAQNY